jgi:hypothetical protein
MLNRRTRRTALLVTAEQSDWHADGIWLGSMGAWANAGGILTRLSHIKDAKRTMLRGEKKSKTGSEDRKSGNHVGFEWDK